MSRRYSFDSDPGEGAPLDNPNDPYSHHALSSRRHSPPAHPPFSNAQEGLYDDYPPQEPYSDRTHPSPSRTAANHPAAHPDSAFNRLQHNRRYSQDPERAGAAAGATAGVYAAAESSPSSSLPRPIDRSHQQDSEPTWGRQAFQPNVTPGADNFSEAAAGGMPGLAMNVAERNARESGLEAMRQARQFQQQHQQSSYPDGYQPSRPQQNPYNDPRGYAYGQGYDRANDQGYDRGYDPGYEPSGYRAADYGHPGQPYQSSPGLAPAAAVIPSPSGSGTPARSMQSYSSDPFRDPQMAYGQRMNSGLGQFNPNDIDDDGDDGLEYHRSARNSRLNFGGSSGRGGNGAAAGAAGAAAGGGAAAALIGRNQNHGTYYDPVQNSSSGDKMANVGEYEMGTKGEQSEWLSGQKSSRKKWKWFILIVVGLAIAGGIAGGVVGGIMSNKGSNGGGGQSADSDTALNGDLDFNSNEIKALMNNPNLHKVFPGVDYTPINVQFPDCLKNPPSQNNVTRDVAVLSQLTNTIRLYGTDCNQTEMTIHALRKLNLDKEMKIWLGVWQDNNDTTNERQLSRMWNVLDQYGADPFKGLIVGNEILFRKQMTATQLSDLLDSVRSNLTQHNWNLPVATSDLGDNWDSQLASISDYIMGNIHPFFAGVNAKDAASWTWSFWHNKAEGFFKPEAEKNVISEIGWPTKGGTDCGDDNVTDCPNGSVAGVDELNTLMENWVCQALQNGTNYFWFEMFDEPWKISFDTPGKEWEDQWGLLDVNRNLKDGVKIPDCGGKTV